MAGHNSVPPTSRYRSFTPNKVFYPHARNEGQTYAELLAHLFRDHDQHERTDNGYVPEGSFDHLTAPSSRP